MLSIKVHIFAIVLLFASVPATQVMAKDLLTSEGSEKEYINTNDIVAMNQGYPLQVEGIGEVLIKSVQSSYSQKSDRSNKSLLINREGLRKSILRHFKGLDEGMHDGRTAMDLAAVSQTPGDIIVCVPMPGSGAIICFAINCDYDPDSAVLPCT